MHAIELKGVGYDRRSGFEIRDLDLMVQHGSIYGFLGPNGSGKTTTIRMIMGMLRATAGSIQVLGYDVPRDSARAALSIGYVPERPHIYPRLKVSRAIAFHSTFYPTWDQQLADRLLRSFGLDPDRRVEKLSKGQMGQLVILLALSQRPNLLVLDEPTDGLDPVVRRMVLSAILDYTAESGCTVFISSHLVHELERICDWVGVLDEGRMVAELPMQAFRSGIKVLRVKDAPAAGADTPFSLLGTRTGDAGAGIETWVVRGWRDPMTQYFDGTGGELVDVVDLDLEEAFVELLNAARTEEEASHVL
jgi:ABC-2 type transport system ATP-binding protein